jgi:hypothetical protein
MAVLCLLAYIFLGGTNNFETSPTRLALPTLRAYLSERNGKPDVARFLDIYF